MLHPHLIAKTRPAAYPDNIVLWKNRRITLLTPRLFRIEEENNGCFCNDATQIVWFRDLPPVPHTTECTDDHCIIRTDAVTLHLRGDLADSYVLLADGRHAALTNDGNLLGTYRTLDCCDGDYLYLSDTDPSRNGVIALEKGVLSRSGVAVLDDSASLLLRQDGTVALRPCTEKDLYIFAYGSDYRAAIAGLYAICGAPPVLPRHALGNWWSRYWAYTQKEYLSLIDSFADRDMPFTVATVDMDWHPSRDLPNRESGWTGYTWNEALFPDYRAFLRELHERNLRVTLNLHPALGVRWFEAQYPEMARRMGVDPETKEPVAFDMTNDDFVNAYFDVLHKPYEQDGVDFWWIDWQQGSTSALEGLDPLWSLNHYHTLDIARDKDALILSRYAGVGSHRYPLGFSGDTHVTWKTLRYMPYFTATASNAGYSWWSHDIGGHMGGIKDDELFLRFVQFGVFSPINRLHSSRTRTMSKDAAAYHGGAGHIMKEFLKLRHAMIPFLYSASCETTEQGLALIEPMYYECPEEEGAYQCPGQYLFGRQLIAAPVTEKSTECGLVTQKVWLPKGTWTDFFTGDVYPGGGWQNMTRPLDSFPLLAKEGGFFVLDGAPEGNSTALPKALDVHVFGGSGAYALTEDGDGHRAVTRFTSEQTSPDTQTVTVSADDPGRILPVRSLTLRFRNVMEGEVSVTVNGLPVSAYTREESGYTLVRVKEWKAGDVCHVTIRETAASTEKRHAAICRMITEMEAGYQAKEILLRDLCACEKPDDYHARVVTSIMPSVWQKRLDEAIHLFR